MQAENAIFAVMLEGRVMSVDQVKRFFEKVDGDKALQAKLKALSDRRKAQADAAKAEVLRIAAEAGFQFTASDLAKARTERARELSMEDLRAVAGGLVCKTGEIHHSGDCGVKGCGQMIYYHL